MSTLAALFGQSKERSSSEDERLLDLYWNRIELKKAFAELRNEKFRLGDELKAKSGEVARLEQKLTQLEQLLIDPEWTRSVMLLYQLRGLGQRCSRKLARFSEQLKQQREQRMQSAALTAWRAGLEQEIAAEEQRLGEIHAEVFHCDVTLQELETSLASMNGLLRLFRRRSARRQMTELTERIVALEAEAEAHRAAIADIEQREPPPTMGLDTAAKRSINFMILAFAQHMYLTFDDNDLVTLVKEAMEKSAGAVRYGNDAECEAILKRLRRSAARLDKSADYAETLRQRARKIGEGAAFSDAEDVVPLPGSVSTVFDFSDSTRVRTSNVDLLGNNYWGIAAAMSR